MLLSTGIDNRKDIIKKVVGKKERNLAASSPR